MDEDKRKHMRGIGKRCACFNLRRAARLVTKRFDDAFRDFGLKATQLSVLMAIYYAPNLPLSRLAQVLGMDRTSLTRNLKILEGRNLVTVEESDDKRERRIGVTPNGEKMLKDVFPIWQKVQDEIEEILGGEHWGNLLSGLHEVARKFG